MIEIITFIKQNIGHQIKNIFGLNTKFNFNILTENLTTKEKYMYFITKIMYFRFTLLISVIKHF